MCSCKKNNVKVNLKKDDNIEFKKEAEIKVVKLIKYKMVEVDRSVKELTKKLQLN